MPVLPDGLRMPRGMQAELKSLSAETAAAVGAHLMMATQLVDSDPELAHRHAEAARRRAARLPITREACAETAYAAGLYDEALTQYRALRRMTGSGDVVPVMVDCLRALGKHREALELAATGVHEITDPAMRVELVIVTAGVRFDMGQADEARRLLKRELERPTVRHPRLAQARLLYAYADQLFIAGDLAGAHDFFGRAAGLDPDGTTAALDRLDEMDGVVLDLDDTEFFPEDDSDHPADQDESGDLDDTDDWDDLDDWDNPDDVEDLDDAGDLDDDEVLDHDGVSEGGLPDGDQPAARAPDGDLIEDGGSEGDVPEGEMSEGSVLDDDLHTDGASDDDLIDGDVSEGDIPGGETSDGGVPDGDLSDDRLSDGGVSEVSAPDGDSPAGELSDADPTGEGER